MEKEKEPNSFEMQPEFIPTLEEVHSILKELIGGEYKEVRKLEDEKGLYSLDVVIPGELENEKTEYSYMRKGRYPEGQASTTAIHMIYYENGNPVGGTSVAERINESWVIL